MDGWIKLYRKFSEKAYYRNDSEKVHLWIHILIKCNHSRYNEMLGGVPILCQPGQFTTGRMQLSRETGISESKIERILTYFEKIEQQIEQQKTNTNRLISVLNWSEYQISEQQIEQQLNNDRTTTEQQLNNNWTHSKNVKNVKNDKNDKKFIVPSHEDLKNYFSEIGVNSDEYLRFFDYYQSKGWLVGKSKMKDWKSAVRNWTRNNNKSHKTNDYDPKKLFS